MKPNRAAAYVVMMILLFQLLPGSSISYSQKIIYPQTRTTNDVDFYFGNKVFDPYRWLEDLDSPEVQAWASEQMQLTKSYLDTEAIRPIIAERLKSLSTIEYPAFPSKHGSKYYMYKREKNCPQYSLYSMDSLNGELQIVIDPNLMDPSGTTAISGTTFSSDGLMLAYGLSFGGSDWQEIHFRDEEKKINLVDTLKWCKFSTVVWSPDNSGIYYTRYPQPGSMPENEMYFRQTICWHKLGTSQAVDSIIFANTKSKRAIPRIFVSSDHKYIISTYWWQDDSKFDIICRDFKSGKVFKLLKGEAGYLEFIGNIGEQFYFQTQKNTPGGRIIVIDLNKPSKKYWRDILVSEYNVIDNVGLFDSILVVSYMEEAYDKLKLISPAGNLIKQVELPELGSIYSLGGGVDDSLMFFSFDSYLYPTTVFKYNLASGEMAPFSKSEIAFDFSQYVTRQITFESSNKVIVPMFLTYRKDLPLDGNNPTILTGYGGFGYSYTPHFDSGLLLWLENGGIYAVANIRGGGEFGRNWYDGGRGYYKQNSFDDFANAAHWLVDKKLTSPAKLAIWGASNGGLLTAVSMEQNPELFGAVISQVPVTDMIRFHRFTVGGAWLYEYGDPTSDAGNLSTLRAYSPLHNVSHWAKYPPLLVTTGENDDRVPPLHAYKFIAAIQAEDEGIKPKLLRIDKDAGHGRGKPFDKYIEEQTDIYTFIFKSLDIDPRVSISQPDTTK